ncbi:MAG TPA: hypothetical protein VK510_03210 [Solirubrobacteraceae bacterium]|nr:hypothetical protein [Solirubrobacteraceae bacterium]
MNEEAGEIEKPEGERCQRCHAVGLDRRTLWMSCLYNMLELGMPFEQVVVRGEQRWNLTDAEVSAFVRAELAPPAPQIINRLYTLRVCKDCRASWMQAQLAWFTERRPLP